LTTGLDAGGVPSRREAADGRQNPQKSSTVWGKTKGEKGYQDVNLYRKTIKKPPKNPQGEAAGKLKADRREIVRQSW